MADIKVVIDTVLNEKGLHAAGQGIKSFGATLGIALGAAYAFNAGLDKIQSNLEDIGETNAAKKIEESQKAWEKLGDTILLTLTDTGAIDTISWVLKEAAESARKLFIVAGLGAIGIAQLTGKLTEAEAHYKAIDFINKAEEFKSKTRVSEQKKLTDEKKKQLDLEYALEDALAAGDARAIRKAQEALGGGKVSSANPSQFFGGSIDDFVNKNVNRNMGGVGGASNITLTIKSDGSDMGDWMAQAMTNAEISGARTDRQR